MCPSLSGGSSTAFAALATISPLEFNSSTSSSVDELELDKSLIPSFFLMLPVILMLSVFLRLSFFLMLMSFLVISTLSMPSFNCPTLIASRLTATDSILVFFSGFRSGESRSLFVRGLFETASNDSSKKESSSRSFLMRSYASSRSFSFCSRFLASNS